MWPLAALVVGVASIVVGIGISATARQWPDRARKYDAVRTVDSSAGEERDELDAWDSLSDGDDPTAR